MKMKKKRTTNLIADADELLKVGQVAAVLGFVPMTVYRMLSDGKIPFVQLGLRIRVKRSDLEKFIASSVVPASAK